MSAIASTRSSRTQQLGGATAVLGRYGWLIVAVGCLWLGYMVIWQRGQYMDDYSYTNLTVDVVTGQQHFLAASQLDRKLSFTLMFNLASMIPTHELPLRALFAAIVGINALLLATLVWRVTSSRVASVISGWLFLMPFTAAEAVLWFSAACEYPVEMLFALLFLHACYSACAARRSAAAWGACAALFFVASLACGEQVVLAIGLVPLIGLAVSMRQGKADRGLALKRCLALVLVPLAVAVVWAFAYGDAINLLSRGGMDASVAGVLQRVPGYLSGLESNTVAANWGRRLTATAFDLGSQVLGWSKRAKLALAVALFGLALTVVAWRRNADEKPPGLAALVALFGVGVLWFFAALVLPASLVVGQIYEARLTYIPFAGAAVACGAAGGILGWLSRRLLGKAWGETSAVAIAGVALILASVIMLGYGWTFAERSRVDKEQVSAFVRAIPAASLPANPVVVPWHTDDGVLSYLGAMSRVPSGVFETSWSAAAALQAAYHRKDISAVATNRWSPMRFAARSAEDQTLNQVRIQNRSVPVDRAILFTCQDKVVYPIESLTLTDADGSQQVVRFPIAGALAARGVPTRETIVVQAR